MKAANNNDVTGEEMKAIRETLVACLNEWRARLKADDRRAMLEVQVALSEAKRDALTEDEKAVLETKALSSEERSKLFMNCIEGVRLLLLSYGPAPPDADKEFVKLLLFMRGMREDKKALKAEPEPIPVIKRQKTITEYFS